MSAIHDYIPGAEGSLATWLANYKTKIAAIGATCGMSPLEVSAEQAFAQNLIDKINAVEAGKTAQQAIVASKNTQKTTSLTGIRDRVAKLKTNNAFTAAMSSDLGTVAPADSFNPDTYKTVLTPKLAGGHIRIDFIKGGAAGLNIYARLKGETTWVFMAHDTHSPYIDTRALANPAIPEAREYMAMGVLHDAEIGLASDVVQITFAG